MAAATKKGGTEEGEESDKKNPRKTTNGHLHLCDEPMARKAVARSRSRTMIFNMVSTLSFSDIHSSRTCKWKRHCNQPGDQRRWRLRAHRTSLGGRTFLASVASRTRGCRSPASRDSVFLRSRSAGGGKGVARAKAEA